MKIKLYKSMELSKSCFSVIEIIEWHFNKEIGIYK